MKLFVSEPLYQVTILYPSEVGVMRISSKETFVRDIAKIVVELLNEYQSLSFDGPGWVRDALATRGLSWLE